MPDIGNALGSNVRFFYHGGRLTWRHGDTEKIYNEVEHFKFGEVGFTMKAV